MQDFITYVCCASSAAENGQFGCQVWLHSALPVAASEAGHATWRADTLRVIHSEPRALLVTCAVGAQTYAFLSAHAPTAAAGEDTLLDWWSKLESVVRRVPSIATLFCRIDANARFQTSRSPPPSHALSILLRFRDMQLLCQFATAEQLACSRLGDHSGRPVHTWTSPNGKPAWIICSFVWQLHILI